MAHKKLSTLYKIILQSLKSDRSEKLNGGICGEINFLIERGYNVTEKDVSKLRTHFETLKPFAEELYSNHNLWQGRAYWWKSMTDWAGKPNKEALEVRIEFMERIIDNFN